MGDKNDWQVQCPFYLCDNYTYIRCEGIVGMNTTSWFHNKQEMIEHKRKFCRTSFKVCPLFKTLEMRYDE